MPYLYASSLVLSRSLSGTDRILEDLLAGSSLLLSGILGLLSNAVTLVGRAPGQNAGTLDKTNAAKEEVDGSKAVAN